MGYPVDLAVCYLIEPFGTTAGRTFPHTGDDFARRKVDGKVVAEKPDILAAHSGTVIAAGWHAQAGWRTVIRYWFGRVGVYGHQAALLVTVDQAVKLGQKIGVLGGTGKTSGPHLHYAEYTNEARALSGIVQHWKTKEGRVLWGSVDAWAAASGLARPDYRLSEKASKQAPAQAVEEDDMYTDQDRARDDSIYRWLQDVQPKVAEIHADVNALAWLADREDEADRDSYALAQVFGRIGIWDNLPKSASAAEIASQVAASLNIPGIGAEQVQAIATAVADEHARRLTN